MQGFRSETIRPTESAADSVDRGRRVVQVTERGDGTAIVTGTWIVFPDVDSAYSAALESVYNRQSSYYMADVRVTRVCPECGGTDHCDMDCIRELARKNRARARSRAGARTELEREW